jgi:hypothetical protein
MDEESFRRFLRRGGRSENAAERAIRLTREYEAFLLERRGRTLDEASPGDLFEFTRIWDQERRNTKGYLWAIRYYYQFVSNREMSSLARELRSDRIKRAPTPLNVFPGIEHSHLERLASIGIRNVDQMLKAGRMESGRVEMSEKSGVPQEAILELVRLSDLSLIPGVKGTRARLYHDAGVDTLEKMAQWDPEELRLVLVEFVRRTGFDGIAPWPSEAQYSVEAAKRLVLGERFEAMSLRGLEERET